MKILKFFLFAAIALTFAACSSDDDGVTPVVELNIANLVGTYDIFSITDSSETTVTGGGTTVQFSTYVSSGDTFTNTVFTFNADGTYVSSGSYRDTSTTTFTGQAPETVMEIVTIDDSGTYSIDTVSRTLTLDGDDVYDVTVFNGTSLTITDNYTETSQSFTDEGTFEIKMTKQN